MGGISKSNAIRAIARESDPSHSNKWIAEQVKRKYGLDVRASQIIGILGPHKQRKHCGKIHRMRLELAEDYLRKMGGKDDAIRFLHLARSGARNDS